MCEFCERIKKASFNKTIFEIDKMHARYGDSFTYRILDNSDYMDMVNLADCTYCPKCGKSIYES